MTILASFTAHSTLPCCNLPLYSLRCAARSTVLRGNHFPLNQTTNSAFKTDPAVKVLLISLKAGGVALNLTVASRIFLMGKIL
jgi:hypothetical protein